MAVLTAVLLAVPQSAPSGRISAGTADVAGQLVLFGGSNVTEGFLSDLWTWHPAG